MRNFNVLLKKASDDDKYRVASSDFEKYCTTLRLDDNIEDSNFTGRKNNKNSVNQCCIHEKMNYER